jgi:hypothetical protein
LEVIKLLRRKGKEEEFIKNLDAIVDKAEAYRKTTLQKPSVNEAEEIKKLSLDIFHLGFEKFLQQQDMSS